MNIGSPKFIISAVLVVGFVVGAGAVISTTMVNQYTSTDTFCSSCHSMTYVAEDPHYRTSQHVANDNGVKVGCADCHIPAGNIFAETYTHVSQGLKDIIAEQTNDFSDPAVWEARRIELAHEVRAIMRSQDSVTCRGCHDPASIQPSGTAGKAAHTLLQSQDLTCIDCHINLVHEPVPPAKDFVRGSGLGAEIEMEK